MKELDFRITLNPEYDGEYYKDARIKYAHAKINGESLELDNKRYYKYLLLFKGIGNTMWVEENTPLEELVKIAKKKLGEL